MLHSTVRAAIGCAAFACAMSFLHADTDSFSARAERAYAEAQHAVRKDPTNDAATIHLSRAAFDWAEFARDDDSRAEIAERGIDAARIVIKRQPTNGAAQYWLGMNLGQLARTRSLGALRLVREMEEAFHRARTLDERTDYAGPDRSLGYLYRDAPGWPTSVGNKKKSREHFERAVQLHPEFPDNQLGLLESFDKWGDKRSFARQLTITEKIINEARGKFTGAAWDSSWADWNKRFAEMKRAAGKSASNKVGK
jgi:tetratricopeptide (TPR) repeat protein